MYSKSLFYTIFIGVLLFGSNLLNAQKQLNYESYKLENGLTVILNVDHSLQKVFGVVVVKAGGKDDPPDATGMAHYQEHILFKGTQELGTVDWAAEKVHIDKIFELYDKLGKTTNELERAKIQTEINKESREANKYAIPNELSNIIKSMGGTNLNAGTGMDQTLFYNAFPSNEIDRWLELYSHRFLNPVFRGFQAELEVVYEEKNLYNDMFQTKLLDAFNSHFYKNHPYGQQTIIGTTDDLKNPSLTGMKKFFDTWYVANNMALVLVGDFDVEKIKPLIEAKFGRLKSGDLPERKVYAEEAFNGREFFEAKLSPIKLAILGFRTVPAGHPDELKLTIANSLLSNEDQTGMLDQLALDNKLLAAMSIPMIQNDHGSTIFFIVPKIMGQKLEEAEALTLEQINLLKEGAFSDQAFEAVKQSAYKNFMLGLENFENKAVTFASIFSRGQEIEDFLNRPQEIKELTKQDIIDVANKYYGDNFLVFYSKMGFPKNDKIEKPNYKPLITNTDKKSAFLKYFETIKVEKADIDYVDFEKDVAETQLNNGNNLYVTKNPLNNVFSFDMEIGVGNIKEPLLMYATELMNYCGTESKDIKKLKAEFSRLGTSYYISSDDNYITISLTGIDENFEKSINLLSELLSKSKLDAEKLDIIVEGVKTNRKMEKSEPANVADALFEYMKYKNKSEYIDRLTVSEIEKLKTDDLTKLFQNALKFETVFHYVGKLDQNSVRSLINKDLTFIEKAEKSESPISLDIQQYSENTVLFVNKSKALQSKIYFMINGVEYKNEQLPVINAFNQYFGGGFSGLVLQEIREYRSMAYSAGAKYIVPRKEGINSILYGMIGTQADKTLGAIEIFNGLIREMPKKTERADMIRYFLIESALSATPAFRELSTSIEDWKTRGYTQDPRIENVQKYENLTFDDINNFYIKNIKSKPMVIAIVGDKKSIDMNELKKYGKIIVIKEKDLFKD